MNIEKREIGTSILRTILAGVSATNPVLGVILSETLMDYWSRVKVERMMLFTEKMKEYFDSLSDDEIDEEFLRSEDFAQFFELVLKRVSETKSKEKINIFSDILSGRIRAGNIEDFSQIYLNTISQLHEKQIEIILELCSQKETYEASVKRLQKFNEDISIKSQERLEEIKNKENGFAHNLDRIDEQIKDLVQQREIYQYGHNNSQKRCRTAEFYNIKEMDFEFFLRDLISKGLLYEAGIGTHGYLPLKSVSPTSLAFELIKFIKTT